MESRSISQEFVAKSLGVSRQTVGGWLRGAQPQPRHRARIEERIGVSPERIAASKWPGPDPWGSRVEAIQSASKEFDPLVAAYENLLKDCESTTMMARDRLKELSRHWHARVKEVQSELLPGGSNLDLTTSASSANALTVREIPNLDELLNEVRSLTKAPGVKKALADGLGFKTQAQLSRWLSVKGTSATYTPSAANALKLLSWVVEQRRVQQKKGAEAVSPAPAPTTARKRSSKDDEKSNSDRQKISPKAGENAIAKRARREAKQ